jgi:hypothetical protein
MRRQQTNQDSLKNSQQKSGGALGTEPPEFNTWLPFLKIPSAAGESSLILISRIGPVDPQRVLQVLVVYLCDLAFAGAKPFDPQRVLQEL